MSASEKREAAAIHGERSVTTNPPCYVIVYNACGIEYHGASRTWDDTLWMLDTLLHYSSTLGNIVRVDRV